MDPFEEEEDKDLEEDLPDPEQKDKENPFDEEYWDY